MIDIRNEDRDTLGGDAARKPLADRDRDTPLDLFLNPLRGPRHELLGLLVEQQDCGRVHRQSVANADQQLIEELLETELGQRGVAQPIERADLGGRGQVGRSRRQHDLSRSRRVTWDIHAAVLQSHVTNGIVPVAKPNRTSVRLLSTERISGTVSRSTL